MSTLELQAELAKKIFTIENENVLKELSRVIKRLTNRTAKLPGIPTEEQMYARAEEFLAAYEDFRNGDTSKFTSQEELRNRHRRDPKKLT